MMRISGQTNQNPFANPLACPDGKVGQSVANKESRSVLSTRDAEPSPVSVKKIMSADAFAEAWKELEHWRPSLQKTPAENVQDLKDRYLALQNYIVETVGKELQAQQLAKLDTLMTHHVETLLGGQYGELSEFLQNNKQELAAFVVKNSLLFYVLGQVSKGKPVWPEAFLQQGKQAQQVLPPQNQTTSNRSADQGMLQYGRDGKTNIRLQSDPSRSSFAGDPRSARAAVPVSGDVITCASKKNTLKALFPNPFTLVELEQSNAFAKHMNQYSISGSSKGTRVVGNEWIGIRAGITWLKGQMFATLPAVSKPLSHMMQHALEHQIYAAIRQVSAVLKGASASGARPLPSVAPIEQAVIVQSYHDLVSSFTKHKDASSAIISSIYYMVERLKLKEFDSKVQNMQRPQDRWEKKDKAGLEQADEYLNAQKRSIQHLKESWNDFLEDMHVRSATSLDFGSLQELYSMWAYSMPPCIKQVQHSSASARTLLAWFGLGVCIVVAILMFEMVYPVNPPVAVVSSALCIVICACLAVKLLLFGGNSSRK